MHFATVIEDERGQKIRLFTPVEGLKEDTNYIILIPGLNQVADLNKLVKKFSENGFQCIIPELNRSREVTESSEDFNLVWLENHQIENNLSLIRACVEFIEGHEITPIPIVGLCWGASLVLRYLSGETINPRCSCGVAVCPPFIDPSWGANLKVPTLTIFPRDDPFLSSTQTLDFQHNVYNVNTQRSWTEVHSGNRKELIKCDDIVLMQTIDWLFTNFLTNNEYLSEWWRIENIAPIPPSEIDWQLQGSNGQFFNIGERNWEIAHKRWLRQLQPRFNPPPPPAPLKRMANGLSSSVRSFELPGPTALNDVVRYLDIIWKAEENS